MCEARGFYLAGLSGALFYSCHSAKLPTKHQFAVAEHLFKQDGLLYSPHPAKPFIRSRGILKQQHVSCFPLTPRFVAGSAFVAT